MAKKFDLIVVGEINPDLILTGDVTPAFGQVEQIVSGAELAAGSSSCIFALGAARLGLKVAFIGKIGDDLFGEFMRGQLAARQIDAAGVVVDKRIQTGISVILSRGADRAIMSYAGTITELRYEEIDFGLLAQARHLHVGAYFMLERLRPRIPELFERAHRLGLTVSLDTNYDPAGAWQVEEALAGADVFLPNETELRAITGLSGWQPGLEKLGSGGRIIAVKRGAEGGAACQNGNLATAPALPVEVVDTTGAGDSFDAGFVYGFLQGWELERSLKLACACGSLSTRAPGGTGAQPTLEEALRYI